jgi:hypothetical protein
VKQEIRQIRKVTLDEVKALKSAISEDDSRRLMKEVQHLCCRHFTSTGTPPLLSLYSTCALSEYICLSNQQAIHSQSSTIIIVQCRIATSTAASYNTLTDLRDGTTLTHTAVVCCVCRSTRQPRRRWRR